MNKELIIAVKALGNQGGQFHQHFWHQSRAAFVQIIFNDFKGNSIWQKSAKI